MATRRSKQKSHASKNRKTRRATVGVTVEGLHASFSRIDDKVKDMIAKGKTDSEIGACIQKAWSEQFHMDLSSAAMKGMIIHYRAVHRSGNKRKTRKSQRGGMAPVDWIMGQGTTDNVYGRFPVEIGTTPQVVNALDLGRFYESRVGRSCDATGGHAAPGQQLGGGVLDAVGMGFAPASVPRNIVETGVSALQGAPIANPSASPVSASTQMASYAPKAFDTTAISSFSVHEPIYNKAH